MKVLVAGSRGITSFDLEQYIPSETELVITGGAKGVDQLAEQYADTHRISKFIMRPQYDLYGRAAPLKRNEVMVDMADLVIVVWDGVSKGTKHTIEYAKKKQKNLILIQA
jgi:uncharacterized phage-like protein YoqJ